MRTAIAITLILCGTLMILAPAISDQLLAIHDAQYSELLGNHVPLNADESKILQDAASECSDVIGLSNDLCISWCHDDHRRGYFLHESHGANHEIRTIV